MVQEMAQGGRWWGNGVCEGCLKTAGVRWCRAGDSMGEGHLEMAWVRWWGQGRK